MNAGRHQHGGPFPLTRTGENQWSGWPRCGVVLTRGKNKGLPCGRVISDTVGNRMLCFRHAKLGRKLTGGK